MEVRCPETMQNGGRISRNFENVGLISRNYSEGR